MPTRHEGLAVLAVLLVAGLALALSAWRASNRTPPVFEPPVSAGASAEPSARPTTPTTAPSPSSTDAPVLAFYGDWFVSGTDEGGLGPAGWPAIVSERIGAEGTAPHAVTDAGYVAESATSSDTFRTLAENFPEPEADVTVVFGGRNDYRATPAEITAAATRTFETVRTNAPETELLVIGPAWTDVAVPPELLPVRDAIRQAAQDVGAAFLDPLEEGWLVDRPDAVASDLISPTDAGHAQLADRIEPVLREVLADAPGPTATGIPLSPP